MLITSPVESGTDVNPKQTIQGRRSTEQTLNKQSADARVSRDSVTLNYNIFVIAYLNLHRTYYIFLHKIKEKICIFKLNDCTKQLLKFYQ